MTMQLKEYQQRTLARVDEFLRLCKLRGIPAAYAEVSRQMEADGTAENPYRLREYETRVTELEDCPHVCVRIPTGGGKTLLSAHSIPLAARFMERELPVVLWMVPSDTIRTQTTRILRDPLHPCRAFLDGEFDNQVAVCDIADFDAISAAELFDKACVIVSTIQAFKSKSADMLRVYRAHESLDSHFARLSPESLAAADSTATKLRRDKDGQVLHSFANLLRVIRPAIIADEAHSVVVSDKSHEVLRTLRPSCILEFTATPREETAQGDLLARKKHNILVSVPARELRKEEMIKLPVRLTEHKTWREAVNAAVMEQKRLEEIARESGDSVRPIILYQAETDIKSSPQRATWDKLREHLLEELGEGGEKQVAVETGNHRELEGIDLLSADCEIRHVITVQALREGWDCPFAYALCSVADVSGATAIEQILGRVLRMPFARERKAQQLNLAYAHVVARDYAEAVDALSKRMAGRMGFDEDDLRESIQRALPELREDEDAPLYGVTIVASEKPDFGGLEAEALEAVRDFVEVRPRADGAVAVVVREEISESAQRAIVAAVSPEKKAVEKGRLDGFIRRLQQSAAPARRGVKFALMPQLKFKSEEDGEIRVVNADEFHYEAQWDDLGAECILGEADFGISETGEVFMIRMSDANKMVYEREGQYSLPLTREEETDSARLSRWLEREIRDPQGRYIPETLREFVRMNLEALAGRGISLAQLSRAKYQLAEALRWKLEAHSGRVLEKSARGILFNKSRPLRMEFDFSFPQSGEYQYNTRYCGNHRFERHYYHVVGDLKDSGEEYLCAMALDSLEGKVRHWIRNVQQKSNSYRIPLATGANFYPDFVAELEDENAGENAKVLVVEYKGGFLEKDAEEKRKAGELMETMGEGRMFFLMPSRRRTGPSVRDQIRAKIKEIMAA